LIDTAIHGLEDGYEYFCNVTPPTFPDGLDVEAFSIAALHRAWANAQLKSEREHVTPYLRTPSSGVKCGNWSAVSDFSNHRWTVDHPDDLDHVRALVAAVNPGSPVSFDRFDIYRAIERSRMPRGAHHERNEGLAKSLRSDNC
jgi:spore coat polysaccharide biosynthesis protein SpsF